YLITGHFHHEKSLRNAGITHYQVSSPSKNTQYEKNSGFITSEKGLMIFEFDDVKRRAIYYLYLSTTFRVTVESLRRNWGGGDELGLFGKQQPTNKLGEVVVMIRKKMTYLILY